MYGHNSNYDINDIAPLLPHAEREKVQEIAFAFEMHGIDPSDLNEEENAKAIMCAFPGLKRALFCVCVGGEDRVWEGVGGMWGGGKNGG